MRGNKMWCFWMSRIMVYDIRRSDRNRGVNFTFSLQKTVLGGGKKEKKK